MRKAVLKSTSTLCSISALATALALASPAAAQVVIDDEQTGSVDLDADEATLEVGEDGSLIVDGDDAVEVDGNMVTITNDGIIRSIGDRAIDGRDVIGTTIINSGIIEGAEDDGEGGSDAIDVSGSEGVTITNTGSIIAGANDTKAIDGGDDLTVTNSGTIRSVNGDGRGIEGDDNLVVINLEGGVIEALGTGAEAIESDGVGLTVVNDGLIRSEFDDAIDGGADVDITNNATGIIRGANNDGLELDNGVIVNAGLIESLSSDPEGDFILDADGNPTEDREIDAGIDFDGVDDPEANMDGMVTNLAGGIIRGDIGINTSSGATGSPANTGSQTIVNFGTIEGRAVNPETGRIDAVLLGAGDDEFQQWQTGVTIGTVDGGSGTDAAIFGNDSDEDATRDVGDIAENFIGFESFSLLAIGEGNFVLTGDGAVAFTVLGGDVTVEGTLGGTLTFDAGSNLAVTGTEVPGETEGETEIVPAAISVAGGDAVVVNVDDFTITNDGTIEATDGRAIEAGDVAGLTIVNSGTIEASDRAINAGEGVTITNNEGGVINTTGDADTIQTGDNLTIINNGTISNEGFDTKIIDAGDGLTVTNNGTITSDWKGIEGEADFTLTNNEGGLIFSAFDEAVEADGPGLTVINNGEIIAPEDDAIDGGADVTIVNTGLIRGGENDGLELDNGTITNSGIIESLSSDPDGDFSDIGLTNRELDAGIDFDGTGDPEANEDGLVTNLAGGIIRGDIGINASSGNFVAGEDGMGVAGSAANFGSQTIVNFGTIEGRLVNPVTGRIDAVLLSFGDDEFQQWTGAVVNGWIDLEDGDDTFILEGASSSVSGSISGGAGDDTAILAGVLDSDNFVGFETIQLGSTLGGTLNDLDISGARTITGDIVHVGTVNVDLGVDSLTTTGTIALAETGVLNIATPLGPQLAGQTVVVLGGSGVTNNGATVNIVEDDFLLDYSLVAGNSVSVLVNAINPLTGNADANLAAIGGAIAAGANAGTFGGEQFAALNALTNAADYAAVLNDALPSLSDGVAREVFETGSLATQALNSHLAAESSGVWGQIAVRGADQDARSATVDGYESDQLVFTLGADIMAAPNFNIGVLASYADIDIDDRTIGDTLANAQEVSSFRIGAYAAAKLGDRGFLNAELSYLTGDVESSRNGRLGQITSAYDFDGVAGRATAGYDLLGGDTVSFTPTVGINFATISFDDAVETGGYGLLVQREDAEFFEARFGAELTGSFSEFVRGYLNGTYVNDLSDEAEPVTLSSSQLPSFTVLPAVREQDRFEVGAGVTFKLGETFGIDVGYLGDFSDGYDGHAARVTGRIAF